MCVSVGCTQILAGRLVGRHMQAACDAISFQVAIPGRCYGLLAHGRLRRACA